MKNIKKIKASEESKKSSNAITRELLAKKGKKPVDGCPEIN